MSSITAYQIAWSAVQHIIQTIEYTSWWKGLKPSSRKTYTESWCQIIIKNIEQENPGGHEVSAMMIGRVIHWVNGAVMVFDRAGQQMPDYQGDYYEQRERILSAAPIDTIFMIGNWNTGEMKEIERESW